MYMQFFLGSGSRKICIFGPFPQGKCLSLSFQSSNKNAKKTPHSLSKLHVLTGMETPPSGGFFSFVSFVILVKMSHVPSLELIQQWLPLRHG